MKTNKYEVFVITFLCYTSIHSLRTSYSYSKKAIAEDLEIDQKYMGIVDALMLTFLGIGHFLHALYPLKKPVNSLWIAMIICGLNYALIPGCMDINIFCSIYILSFLMCTNGFLQSYTWPNLLMIINFKFNPQRYSTALGFWSANTNVGNIIGYGVFQLLHHLGYQGWEIGLVICAFYAVVNGIYIGLRFDQLPLQGSKRVRQQSFIEDCAVSQIGEEEREVGISSFNSLEDQLLDKQAKAIEPESVESQITQTSSQSQSQPQPQSPESPQTSQFSQILQIFKDPIILLLTLTFSLSKSVIYGIMLWVPILITQLPLYFKSRQNFKQYAAQIPIAYDTAAIFGSIGIGYLFKRVGNKGLLMVPFMVVLFGCFFVLLEARVEVVWPYFVVISVVGFSLGGIFNTLSGLVVMQLTKLIPQSQKTSSLGFYSAVTMAVGNITTALTQILIGFVIGKQNQQGIFLVFLIYAFVCLICLILVTGISCMQKGQLRGEVVVAGSVLSSDEQQVVDDLHATRIQHPKQEVQTNEELGRSSP